MSADTKSIKQNGKCRRDANSETKSMNNFQFLAGLPLVSSPEKLNYKKMEILTKMLSSTKGGVL